MAKEKEEPTEGKKSKKKLLIMAGGGAGLIVVLGVVLGVVFMGGEEEPQGTEGAKTHEPSTGEEIGADQGEADGGGEGAAEAGEGAGAQEPVAHVSATSSYVFDDAFVVNVHDATGRRYLNLIMEIETVGPQVVIEIKQNVAPLRDAIIMLLSSKTAEELGKVQGKLKLKQEIIFRLESILEPGSIEAVYFTEFNMLVL